MSFFRVDKSAPYARYCKPDEVLAFLRLPTDDPLLLDVIPAHIDRAEAFIDSYARTCFGGKKCISELEYHTLTKWLGGWWLGAGIPIHLKHRPVRRLIKFEMFNGASWEDVMSRPEGRVTGYWWCEYTDGVCYIQTLLYPMGGREVRVQYEFGYDHVPEIVRQIAILLSAKYFIQFERHRISIVDTDQSIDMGGMLDRIETELNRLLPLIAGAGIISGEVTT